MRKRRIDGTSCALSYRRGSCASKLLMQIAPVGAESVDGDAGPAEEYASEFAR